MAKLKLYMLKKVWNVIEGGMGKEQWEIDELKNYFLSSDLI